MALGRAAEENVGLLAGAQRWMDGWRGCLAVFLVVFLYFLSAGLMFFRKCGGLSGTCRCFAGAVVLVPFFPSAVFVKFCLCFRFSCALVYVLLLRIVVLLVASGSGLFFGVWIDICSSLYQCFALFLR